MRHLVYFVNSSNIIIQTKSSEISTIMIHSVVKSKLTCLSVCLRNTLSKRRQMMSIKVTFFHVNGMLYVYHFALNQNPNVIFIWSVDLFVCVEVLRPSQQLRSCRAGQLPINSVPGQA